jgi:hypothetical protein
MGGLCRADEVYCDGTDHGVAPARCCGGSVPCDELPDTDISIEEAVIIVETAIEKRRNRRR